MKNTLLLLAVTTALFPSCKKDENRVVDTTAPTITITYPSNEAQYKAGDTLKIVGLVNDNENLANLKIDIHEGDGHSHKSAARGTEWNYNHTIALSGTSYNLNHSVLIPATADSAEYHVIINALDASGNAAEFVEIDIDIN